MTRKKVLIDEKKYYIHPIFSKYAASKDGEILYVKTGRIWKKKLTDQGYYQFKVNDTGLNGNVLKVLFQKDLSLIIVILLKQIIKLKIYNY